MNQQMMAQLRKMQTEMTKAQEELASTVVTGSAAGLVSVEMTCDMRVKSVRVDPSAIDPADPETLEDLVAVAVNDAVTKAQETSSKRMSALTGGMRIPGLT